MKKIFLSSASYIFVLGLPVNALAQTYSASNTSYERVSANNLQSYYCDDRYAGNSVGDTTCDDDSGNWYGPANVTDAGPSVGTTTGSSVLNPAIGNNAIILSNANNGAIKRTQDFTNSAVFPDEVWVYETRRATYNYASNWTANLAGSNVNVAASGGASISTANSGITSNLALTGNNVFAGSVTLVGGTYSQASGSTNFQGAVTAPTTNLTGGTVDFDSTLNTNSLTINSLSSANFDGLVTVTGGTVDVDNTTILNFHNGLSAAALDVNGSGTSTFGNGFTTTGSSSFTGGTLNVTAGAVGASALTLTNVVSTFGGAVNLTDGANLTGGGSANFASTLNAGNLTINGLSTASFTGAATVTGGTVDVDNVTTLSFQNGLTAAVLDVNGNGTSTFGNGFTTTSSSSFTGGTLNVTAGDVGASALTLTNVASTFGGAVNVTNAANLTSGGSANFSSTLNAKLNLFHDL